jgi:hypothetical protein
MLCSGSLYGRGQTMSTAQKVSRGFHRLAVFLAAIPLVLGGAEPAASQAKKPTLYVDKIDRAGNEVFVTYNYETQHPPDPEDVLQVARAQCRRLGYANAARSSDPTLRQCTAIGPGAICMRERATDNFSCIVASTN